MALWDVLKPLRAINGKDYAVGSTIELDMRRGAWLRDQHQAVKLHGAAAEVSEAPALLKRKPVPKAVRRRCCGG